MPKFKTRKSIAKRFKVTGTLKVLRAHQSSRHRRAHKTKRQIQAFAEPQKLSNREAKIIRAYI